MSDFQATIEKLLLSDTGDLVELAKIAGKDPKTFYIDADFKLCDLSAQNLSQIDTRYADFSRAKLSKMEQTLWEIRRKVHVAKLDENWVDYAASNVALGAILNVFAERARKTDKIVFIEEEISAYHAALNVYTKDAYPFDWAKIKNNLGNALSDKALWTDGPDKISLRGEAIEAFRKALTVFSKAELPEAWASTTNNLGEALARQALHFEDPDRSTLLREAIEAHRKALTMLTKERCPVPWASTKHHLGIALQALALWTDAAGTSFFNEVSEAYHDALTVYTKAEHPVNWAVAKFDLATLEQSHAWHPACQHPRPHLEAALAYVEEARTVFAPDDMPYLHTESNRLCEELSEALKADD